MQVLDQAGRAVSGALWAVAVGAWVATTLTVSGATGVGTAVVTIVVSVLVGTVMARRATSRPGAGPREQVSDLLVLVAAATIGVAIMFMTVPSGLLDPDGALWHLPYGDRGAAAVGATYFLHDSWHWPLLFTNDLGAPSGTSIAYTDSIPILGLTMKVLRPLTGDGVNYLSGWYFIAFSLQGVAAVSALRALAVRDRVAQVAGAALAVAFPAFLFRGFHAALIGQFTVLWALAAALWATRGDAGRLRQLAPGPFLCLALLVHPYLFVMSAPLVGGIYLDRWRRRRIDVVDVAVAGAWAAVLLVVVLVAGGYLGDYQSASDYGEYGMNLLAPVWPQYSWLVPGRQLVLGDGTVRYEGFNWLGFGVLATVVAALVLRRHDLRRLSDRWLATIAVAVGLTALAVSHKVTIGRSAEVHDIVGAPWRATLVVVSAVGLLLVGAATVAAVVRPRLRWVWLPAAVAGPALAFVLLVGRLQPSLSNVRASGRLFWSVGLLAVLASVALVARSPWRFAPILLVGAAIIQVVDTTPVRTQAKAANYQNLAVPGEHVLVDAMASSDEVVIAPPLACVPDLLSVLDVTVLAAAAGPVPTNTAYRARAPMVDACPTTAPALGSEQTLVLVPPLRWDPGALVDEHLRCRDNGQWTACSDTWADLPASATTPFDPLLAEPLVFAAGADGGATRVGSWPAAGAWGQPVPTDGARLVVPLAMPATSGTYVRAYVRTSDGRPARLGVDDGSGERLVDLVAGTGPQEVEIGVTAEAAQLVLHLRSVGDSVVELGSLQVLLGPET